MDRRTVGNAPLRRPFLFEIISTFSLIYSPAAQKHYHTGAPYIYTALRWAKRLLLEGIVRHRNKSPKRNGACREKRAATAKEKEYKRETPGPASQPALYSSSGLIKSFCLFRRG
jgi:hypothetical protein